jgi:hypothetical protein
MTFPIIIDSSGSTRTMPMHAMQYNVDTDPMIDSIYIIQCMQSNKEIGYIYGIAIYLCMALLLDSFKIIASPFTLMV